jgi:nitroreductase
MEALDALLTRRSVRDYTDQPVPDEMVGQLLRAAMAAPSARNQRPWRFVVVRDRGLLAGVAAASANAGMIAKAQVAVVVCADMRLVRSDGFWVQDCAAATENLLLAAHALGLGAVWCGMYPRDERVAEMRAVLGLPEHVVPFAAVPLGYPAEGPAEEDRLSGDERFESGRVHAERYEEET